MSNTTTTEPKLKPGYTYPDRNPPLHMHYPGQHEPQGAYVQLHPDGEVEFGVNGEIGNAVPESVFHDRIVRICGVDPYLSLKGIDKLHDPGIVEGVRRRRIADGGAKRPDRQIRLLRQEQQRAGGLFDPSAAVGPDA